MSESPFADKLWLAPLTYGGNLPFRRLCVEWGAEVTVGEMAVVKKLLKNSPAEYALLRSHPSEPFFGVQLAAKSTEPFTEAARIAEQRGARFVDLNCGCPTHDITRRGLGASLLKKPGRIARLVSAACSAVSVPITVKLRSGWNEEKQNVVELARICEEAGASALTIHGRTRNQRYSRAADWDLVGRVAAERSIPVVGNGDILTHFEARARMQQAGVDAVMVARGALIKPWVFREIREGRAWYPTPEERVSLLWRFRELLLEHFHDDERGRRRATRFLVWHLGFFHRYRPLPEEEWAEEARKHPLLQTRLPLAATDAPPLERLLSDSSEETHERLGGELIAADDAADALARARTLAAARASAGSASPTDAVN